MHLWKLKNRPIYNELIRKLNIQNVPFFFGKMYPHLINTGVNYVKSLKHMNNKFTQK